MLSIKHVFYGLVEAFRTLKGCPLKDSVAENRGVHVNYVRAQPLLMFFWLLYAYPACWNSLSW